MINESSREPKTNESTEAGFDPGSATVNGIEGPNSSQGNTSPYSVEVALEVPPPAELENHPRYRVVRFLGKGGMGSVWLAKHLILDRWVAVKAIRKELLAEPNVQARFQREVQAQGRLHHPNIATAYDAEQIGDGTFLVVEFVDGPTLYESTTKHPLSIEAACRAIRDASLGLQHAHEQGLIHRDIKPSNLIQSSNGIVKLLDFGLVSIADRPTDVTHHGILIGTPDFIAPEQIDDASKADHRSDIYSLGCTFYFLLSGKPPFQGSTYSEKIVAHQQNLPPPLTNVPQSLVRIVDKMMAKKPEARYQTAGEIAQALSRYLHQHASKIGENTVRTKAMLLRAGGVIVSAGVLLVILSMSYRYLFDIKPSDRLDALSLGRPGAILEPDPSHTSIADGDSSQFQWDESGIKLDGREKQIWINFDHLRSQMWKLRCRVRFASKVQPNYFKVVFQSGRFDDIHLLLNDSAEQGGMEWESSEKGRVLSRGPRLWEKGYLDGFQELTITGQGDRWEAKIGDLDPIEVEWETSTQRHLALSAIHCVIEIRDLQVELE